mmetsp:Transcript_88325/g.176641  ORF Transcript_88325/g.176641 Transcript_88325/m.176641 type:complete len:325 (-) Transcript_88325:773-1747(-)
MSRRNVGSAPSSLAKTRFLRPTMAASSLVVSGAGLFLPLSLLLPSASSPPLPPSPPSPFIALPTVSLETSETSVVLLSVFFSSFSKKTSLASAGAESAPPEEHDFTNPAISESPLSLSAAAAVGAARALSSVDKPACCCFSLAPVTTFASFRSGKVRANASPHDSPLPLRSSSSTQWFTVSTFVADMEGQKRSTGSFTARTLSCCAFKAVALVRRLRSTMAPSTYTTLPSHATSSSSSSVSAVKYTTSQTGGLLAVRGAPPPPPPLFCSWMGGTSWDSDTDAAAAAATGGNDAAAADESRPDRACADADASVAATATTGVKGVN